MFWFVIALPEIPLFEIMLSGDVVTSTVYYYDVLSYDTAEVTVQIYSKLFIVSIVSVTMTRTNGI